MQKRKLRADDLLVKQGLAESREKAKRLIMAGEVYSLQEDSCPEIKKPGHFYPEDTKLQLKKQQRFLSRGGYKLLWAVEHFDIGVQQKTALDVGASTGGFTDCLLQLGASKVYAVDVGYGQLHWKLRQNPRVVNLERINMRYTKPDLLPEAVDLTVVDCSFISLQKILEPSVQFLKNNGLVLALIKPQFELGSGETEKGVVRDPERQQKAVQKVLDFAKQHLSGLNYLGVVPAEIKGPKGNQEYTVLWRNTC